VLLALDDCDDLLALVEPVFFSDLRAMRDNYKVRLAYLTLTRREPAFLRANTPEYEEFFELISAPGHTLAVPPYLEPDALLMLRRLAQRQDPPRSLPESEARRLFELAGGHAGLLRSLFFATLYTAELAAASLSANDWPRLAEHADVEGECRKIWDSLEPEEQADLARVAAGQTPSADGLRRLERRGLLRVHFSRPPEIFSPIFERCVGELAGLRPAAQATPTPPAASSQPVVEFLPAGRQVRVNGQLITQLVGPEYELLRCLAEAAPRPCSRVRLIEVMRLAEHQERDQRVQGDPIRRLETYLHQLKARLGPSGPRIRPAEDGYRLENAGIRNDAR
jgi:hypothetical protein